MPSSSSLPLPPNYFRPPKLAPLHRANLITKAHEVVQDTVKNALSMAKLPIIKVLLNPATRRTANMHEGVDLKDPSLIGMTCVTPVRATFDEVADFYTLNSPRKMRAYAGVVSQNVLDRVTLYTLVGDDTDLHLPLTHVTVIWSVMESNFLAKSIAMKRDACYLECISENYLEDPATGTLRRAWVRAVHSVDMPCCPSMQSSHGFVRGHLVRSGQVFLETDTPGVLDFYWCCITEPNGRLPNMIHRKVLQGIVSQSLNLEQHFCVARATAYFAAQAAASEPSQLPVKFVKKTAFCERCDVKFGRFSTKTQCQKCGWVVCKRCCKAWPLQIAGHVVPTVLCTHCLCSRPDGASSAYANQVPLLELEGHKSSSHLVDDDDEEDGAISTCTDASSEDFFAFKTLPRANTLESELGAVWGDDIPDLAVSECSSQSSFAPYL
ncbi:hypothetical protein SPRG_16217 [Saprolegnia parasitica CBS 223.65]|uniref:FYVE-type domain-containing protein n=1 Tax=Saprolegnia parasitica (strain CBS 223.65) TaxID=695850 RepID=A0A067BUU8_SAPPC|nr:hypothetical protein SPRG_16217 [Saprolegnia parasitica CBS 223.65]KDO18397.1 hypothetical protein SPRG_16217 [Saprolegnia parasitica CBS 223.65]|eukprot:XP_012210895.1 hypothetical protein SPRG_16217 [Saprolegnia parasitica CBS 223.65]